MPFHIQRGNIVQMQVDAIVNAANTSLAPGGGVCGAIFRAAGHKQLQLACNKLQPIQTGEAVMTSGYNLPAQYIIHTAGPQWNIGLPDQEKLLYTAYRHSLVLAKKNNLESIAFPLLSAGTYGCPKETAFQIAKTAILDFLQSNDMIIYLILYDNADYFFDNPHIKMMNHYLQTTPPPISHQSSDASPNITYKAPCALSQPLPAPAPISRKLDDLVENIGETFSESLLRLISEKAQSDVAIYKKANISRKLFSKIRSSKHYQPSKPTVLAFVFALELNHDEAIDLLKRAGYALSNSNQYDIIIEYFLIHQVYDVFEINEVLFHFNQPLLGQ